MNLKYGNSDIKTNFSHFIYDMDISLNLLLLLMKPCIHRGNIHMRRRVTFMIIFVNLFFFLHITTQALRHIEFMVVSRGGVGGWGGHSAMPFMAERGFPKGDLLKSRGSRMILGAPCQCGVCFKLRKYIIERSSSLYQTRV